MEIDASVSRIVMQAWQHAMLELDDAPRSVALVAQAQDALFTRYASTIKNDFSLLFHRIFLKLLRRAQRNCLLCQLPARLGAALIPRSEETMAPHVLESLRLTDPARDPDWSSRPASRSAVAAALVLLPPAQRTAFLLREVDTLTPADAAFVAGCSQRALQRRHARALHTLAAIFAVKGCTLDDETLLATQLARAMPQPDVAQDAALARIAERGAERLAHRPLRPDGRRARFDGWALRHPGRRSALLLCLIVALAGLALYLNLPAPAPDQADTDIRLLSGDIPLDLLVDTHFEEAEHE